VFTSGTVGKAVPTGRSNRFPVQSFALGAVLPHNGAMFMLIFGAFRDFESTTGFPTVAFPADRQLKPI